MYIVRTENKIIGWFENYGDAFDRVMDLDDVWTELVDDDEESEEE